MSPSTELQKGEWNPQPTSDADFQAEFHYFSVKKVPPTQYTVGMSKEQRKELRRKLKEDLLTVQGLSLKLEARESQLRESQSLAFESKVNANNMHSFNGPDVESKPIFKSPKLNMELLKRPSFRTSDSSLIGAEILSGKRTPKANQLYNKTDFVVGKEKIPSMGKSKSKHRKRGPLNMNGGDLKRKQVGIPHEIRVQCKSLLTKLMSHKDGWIFSKPVDAVKLGLSDYHLIVKQPMDLGTIRSKLDRKQYLSTTQFADDVRLTFSNAMMYNPPSNDVHIWALELSNLFESGWEVISQRVDRLAAEREIRLAAEREIELLRSQVPDVYHASSGVEGFLDQPRSKSGAKQKTAENVEAKSQAKPKPKPKPKAQKKVMELQQKAELQRILEQLPEKMLEDIITLMKERNVDMCHKGDEIEVDLESFDNDTLWELYRRAKNCLKSVSKSKKAAMQKNQHPTNGATQNTAEHEQGKDAPLSSSSSSESSSSSGSSSDSGSSSTSDSDDGDT